jgi:hypothetical protein
MHWITNQLDMAENDLIERLQALAKSSERRSKTARLRDVFDHVEGALRAGVARVDVLDELNREGFGLTLASFKSALQRIRRERAGVTGRGVRARAEPSVAAGPMIGLEQNGLASEPTLGTRQKPLSAAERKAFVDAQVAAAFPNRFQKLPGAENTAGTPSNPVEVQLPDDWRTCTPFKGLDELLTPDQKRERTKARDRIFDPNPYDVPLPGSKNT